MGPVVPFLIALGETVAAAIIGQGAANFLAANTLMAIGGSVIAGTAIVAKKVMRLFEVEMPKIDTDRSRQSTVRSTTEPHKIIYGETLVSGPIVYANVAGTDNKHLYHAIALAAHEVEAITDIHLDNEVITNADIAATTTTAATSGRVTGSGTFAAIDGTTICHINKHLGTSTQAADSLLRDAFSSAWTTSHQGKGIAYIVTKFVLNDDSAEIWDKYTPNNIKALVKGRKIYDPRLDSTQTDISGSGSHRLADSTTWEYSTNPALAVADYLMNADFGLGVSSSKIDWTAIKTAADACDASVSVPGGTESRFTCNGVLFGTDSHKTNINKLLSAMNGSLAYIDGYYVVKAGIYEAHVLDLDEDDLAGSIGIKTSLERGDRYNTIKGVFIDPSSNYKSTEFPKVQLSSAYDRDNQEELHKEIALNMTNSSFMAQRIAHKLIQQSNHQKIVTYPTNMKGLRVAVGDRVRITNTELGWTNKVYQCVQWSFNEEGGVSLTLREDAQANYADPTVTPNNEYSEITSDGTLTDAFRGVPAPSGLRAVSAEGKVFLDWVNPGIPQEFQTVHVLVSSDSNLSNAVKCGETDGTQFVHDSNNAATDATKYADGDTRYYWVRAVNFVGTSAQAQSSAHGSVSVTITSDVDWGNIADPTIGIQLDTDDSIQIVYNAETQTSGSAIATSGIEEDVTITQGGITMSNGGAIRGGQTAFNSGTGFFLGHDSSAYKFSIGNSGGEKLTFDGSNLSVTGAVNASSGDFSGQVAVGSTAGTITVIDGNDTDYRLFTNATLDTDTNQYLPDDSSFKVGNDGRVFASNITIYNDDGDVLLSPSGLGAAALNDISTTSGQVVSTVGGTVSNSTSEITLTTSSASESFTITSKVAINDNYDGTQYFSGASTSSTANAEAQLTGVDILIDYYVKADGGSYGASPDVTKTVTIVNSGTPTSTQMRVGGFDRGASYSGSLTRYFAVLQDFGGALEIIPNSGGGASSYVVTTASLGSSLFPSAQTYKIKIVMRVVEDGTTTVISGSTTPPSSDNTTTGIYFDGGNSDERHYEITGTGLIKNSDNNFTSGSQNLLSSGGTISGNLTVTGDFTVQGTTTTIDTATLNVEDKNITLNYGSGDTSASADGAGITIQDAVNSSTDATLNWNATNDRWEFSHQMKTPSLMVGAKERIDSDGDLNNIRNLNIGGTITSVGTTDASFAGGATFAGNLSVDNGTNSTITVLSDDDGESVIKLHGNNQGSGRVFVGQSGSYGGGIEYNGDNSPALTGAGSDKITLYRVDNGTYEWTARNSYNSNDWEFRGGITWSGGSSTNANTAYTYSQVGHLPLAGGTLTGSLTGTSAIFSGTVAADRLGYNAGGFSYLSQTVSGATTILGHNVRAHATVNNRADTVNGSWHGHAIAMYYDRGISFYTTSSTVAAGTTLFSSNIDTTNLRMRIAPNGDFDFRDGSFSNVGAITSTGAFKTYSAIGANDNVRTGVAHYDTTAMASGVGGQLVLGYKYTSSGDYTEGAILKMYKENATSGQYGSGLKFQVRNHGANLSTKMTLNPSGDLSVTGGITAKNATLTDDGSSSPILKISADDSGPWAIQLYREDLSGGPQVYASSASTWSFQGHIDLRSGYGYKVNTTTVIDSNRNATFASLKQGSYVRLLTGASNTGQITFNANWDGSGYVPDYAGAGYAGMTVLKMPAGGEGGLQVYTKNSGTTSTSQALSTFTKVADFHSGGYFDASNGLRVGGTQVFDTSQQITANGSRFRTVTSSNSPSGSNIDLYIEPDTTSGGHVWRVISGGNNTGYGVGVGGLGFYYNNNSAYNLILKPDMSAVFGNQVSINHGALSSEPYSGLVVTNSATSGAAYTGITADAKFQTHYRYKINGALKWQTRAGNANGTDDFRLYSWTTASDILTVKPTGEGQLRFFKDSGTQYSDSGTSTGSLSISGYAGQDNNTSNPTIAMSANTGGYAMFYMNRIYNGSSIGFDNAHARYFDFYRDGSSKVRIVNSSSDQFGFYQTGGNSFNVWNSGATQTFQVSNGGVVSIPAGTLQVKGTWIGRSNTAGHFYVGNNDWTDLLTSTNVSGFDPNDWVYNATNKGVTCTNSNWVRVKVSMPIDPDASYRVRVRVTKHSGSGTFYCAVNTLNENLTELSSDAATSYNYGVASGVSPGTNSTYQAIFSGYNATNTGTTTKFDPEGKYFDIVLICNYGGTGSTTIHSLEVERLPESLITNNIAKKTTGSPITINSGQDASRALRVYYDMDVYNTIHFTNTNYASQGSIAGSGNNLAYRAATHDFYTGSSKNALGFRLYQANTTWDVANVYSTYSTGAGLSLDATGTAAGSKWSIISQGSSGGAGQDNLGFHLSTARSGSGYSTGYKAYLDNSGLRINGTLSATGATIDGGTSTTFQVICDDAGVATIRAMGEGQGTGRLFVGQSSSYGGGVEYNGDNSPASTGAGSDYITLYRVAAGTYYWTARNYYNSNDWQFRGNVTAYASDERLKENITPITDALSKVKSLRGVEFDWRDKCQELGFIPTMKHETGVIAQNVQAVIPDAAVPAPFNEEYLTVKHEKIIPLLIEAIKEQQSIIESLTKRLEKIENDDDKND